MSRQSIDIGIMVALAHGDKHSYGIYKQLLEDASSGLFISEWAVYRALPCLIKRHQLEIIDASIKPIRYRLARVGKMELSWEQERIQKLERLISERLSELRR